MLALTKWLIEQAAVAECAERPNLFTQNKLPGRSSAARQRRARERARNGKCILRLEIDEHLVAAALIESHRLTEDQALDRRTVEREVAAILEQWAARWPRLPWW